MAVEYGVNLASEGRDYPHYWELCVGSCHAATLLRADVQAQIRRAHREIGFKYIRFHGLLDDDMSVVIKPMMPFAAPRLSFFNIDTIFDFLLDAGMKPFVELGFMPEAYASTEQTTFHYKGFSSMPKKDEDWSNLITALVAHLEERYGAAEIRSWFFEVWNEPNLRFFFDGTMKDYFHLYELTARAIKGVDEKLRVGGPATSNNMWIPEFRAFCEKNDVPYDFITTHHYPSDDPLSRAGMNTENEKGHGWGDAPDPETMTEEEIAKMKEMMASFFNRVNKNPRDVLYQMTKKAKEEAGDYPLYYTEWNAGHYDTSYAAAGVAATLAYNEGLVEGYSYWCISDIFEELGLNGLPFNNEFGLVNVYGVRKPVYRLFEELHKAGNKRLSVENIEASRTAEVLALSDGETVTLFVYNHDIEERDIKEECVALKLAGEVKSISVAWIDSEHTNPCGCWEAMGKPAYPTKAQLAEIEYASQLVWENCPVSEGENILNLKMEPESVAIVKAVLK